MQVFLLIRKFHIFHKKATYFFAILEQRTLHASATLARLGRLRKGKRAQKPHLRGVVKASPGENAPCFTPPTANQQRFKQVARYLSASGKKLYRMDTLWTPNALKTKKRDHAKRVTP
jgi:hypothetical protein